MRTDSGRRRWVRRRHDEEGSALERIFVETGLRRRSFSGITGVSVVVICGRRWTVTGPTGMLVVLCEVGQALEMSACDYSVNVDAIAMGKKKVGFDVLKAMASS